jgi:hypothetical protein
MFWLADFLHQSPGKLVQTLHEQAQQGNETQDPIELCLDVGGWPKPKSLYFISDLILEMGHERNHEVDLQSAVGIVLDFYLNLRMAAAFALRAQRLAETRGLPTDGAIEAWALWEHGYSGLEGVSDHELGMIGKRIEELKALHSVGQQVLRAQEGKEQGAGKICVPAPTLDAIPRPPARIRWGKGEPLQARRAGSFFAAMLRHERGWSFEEGQIAAMLFKGTTTGADRSARGAPPSLHWRVGRQRFPSDPRHVRIPSPPRGVGVKLLGRSGWSMLSRLKNHPPGGGSGIPPTFLKTMRRHVL